MYVISSGLNYWTYRSYIHTICSSSALFFFDLIGGAGIENVYMVQFGSYSEYVLVTRKEIFLQKMDPVGGALIEIFTKIYIYDLIFKQIIFGQNNVCRVS